MKVHCMDTNTIIVFVGLGKPSLPYSSIWLMLFCIVFSCLILVLNLFYLLDECMNKDIDSGRCKIKMRCCYLYGSDIVDAFPLVSLCHRLQLHHEFTIT